MLATNLEVSDAIGSGPRAGGLATMVSGNPPHTADGAAGRAVWGLLAIVG